MKELNNFINESTGTQVSYYQVIGESLNPDSGRSEGDEIVAIFTNKSDAIKYKKAWEDLWKEHADNHEAKTPCWMDFEKTLKIEEVKVWNSYDDSILQKQYK